MSNDGDPVDANDRTVGGRYRLIERIGSGGAGTVWRAHDVLGDREVAVKQPRLPGTPEDETYRRAAHRLHREARAAARVDHPSAVSILDVVVEEGQAEGGDGLPWIVMELIRGESLREALARGPLDPAEAARIGLAVLGALRAAHAVGIVHRDVKPANVLLGPHGRVVLTDFGIAHVHGEEPLTGTGEFAGSPEFVAPEGLSGRGAGPASDLWSLGVLLYAAVEGRSPFRRTTPEATLAAVLAAAPPEPVHAGPLGPLLTRLLARDPEQRPDAAEAAAELKAAAGERGAAAEEERGAAAGGGETPAEGGLGVSAGDQEAEVSAPVAAAAAARAAAAVAGGRPGPHPAAPPDPGLLDEARRTTTPTRTRRPLRSFALRPLPIALLALLLAGGVWLAGTGWGQSDAGAVTEWTGTYTTAPAQPTEYASPSAWVAHDVLTLDAVLSVPSGYEMSARRGGADAQPRLVVYSAGSVDVRLALWDRAPAAPMVRAAEAHGTWLGRDEDARTRTTRTTFHGYEAALADTTYGLDENPTRVMELFVRTDDGRMYELRVDMPKGTPQEKQGTTVFEGARDRLELDSR
ncbi:serine/threonine-protein kinase [Streptomyces sp. NPDC001381]|uniref:serine/threonine-protein kinase n=1 Tax=Streptomyces sp. NPDC001381 TaxID=3364567 RepID=UPI0036B08BBD